MNHNPYESVATERVEVASEAEVDERLAFVRRTYLTLATAIVAFLGIEFAIFQAGMAMPLTELMLGWGGGSWLITLGLFIGVGWIANRLAFSDTAAWIQYAGLGLYVLAEAVIFVPLMVGAALSSDPTVIPAAGIITLSVFSVLTGYVFVTKQDFSFLGPGLAIGGAVAMGTIVVAILFGFTLGTFFAIAMVALAAGYILYTTSNILHHYRTDQHAAAALALFAAVAMMFYYILWALMGFD